MVGVWQRNQPTPGLLNPLPNSCWPRKALAVNGATRSAVLPDVPTLKEAGFDDADYPTWFGLFLPAGTAA